MAHPPVLARPLSRTLGALAACALLLLTGSDRSPLSASTELVRVTPDLARGRLVNYESLEEPCPMPAEDQLAVMRMARAAGQAQGAPAPTSEALNDALRQIKDPYPSFAAVAVDPGRNEVIFTDESLFQVLVYDRLENTPDGAPASRPKRVIVGDKTNIEFQSGVWVDQKSGEIYAVNNDTRDTTVVFPAGGAGDVAPTRAFSTPHGTFGLAVDNAHEEAFFTVQHDAAIVTYWKGAGGRMNPVRLLQGSRTKLADPHGIAYDPREDVIYVANFGSRHDVQDTDKPRPGVPSGGKGKGRENWPLGREYAVPGSGTIAAPSISVYRRTAQGNEPPLRVIEGSNTRFNWPTGLAFDSERQELFVANDMGPSVLVFDAKAKGNAPPKRIIKGAKTGLANPTGVAVDAQNHEVWVANFGGHTATAYPIDASGDVAPVRTIRNAPPGTPSLMIGNPGAVAYDTKREEILVPN